MTIRAIAELSILNVLLAVFGTSLLLVVRPSSTRRDLVRLIGVSYLLGVCALMIALTMLSIVGVPIDTPATAITLAVIFTAAALVARSRRRALAPTHEERRVSVRPLLFVSAPALALTVVCLEAIFRKARLQGLIEFDGWDSWVPKAKALFYFGHLEPAFLHSLAGGSYPPGIPLLLATAMHSMGSADVVTLHVQYWFFAVGFLTALAGILLRRVGPLILFPFLLLVFVMPDIRSRSVDIYGDLPLGYMTAIAAVLIGVWLERKRPWHLPAAAVLLAGAALTKREGVLLAGCVVLAGMFASADRFRRDAPRLLAVFAAAFLAVIPWDIWLRANGLPGNGPQGGTAFLSDYRRAWKSLVVVSKNLFDYNLHLVAPTVAVAAICLCVLAGVWRIAVYAAALLTLLVLGSAVIVWSDPSIVLEDVNLISRLVGTTCLVLVAISPLLLRRAWDGCIVEGEARPSRRTSAWWLAPAWVMVAAAAIAYPATLLVEGGARFPGTSASGLQPTASATPVVASGNSCSHRAAFALQRRAPWRVTSVSVRENDCGGLSVSIAAAARSTSVEEALRDPTQSLHPRHDACCRSYRLPLAVGR